jgi:hypothetical protein
MDTTITVKRKSNFVAMLRPFTVKVDGNKMAAVKNGQQCMFSIAPGQHQIEIVGALWARSQIIAINATEGAALTFECGIMNKYVMPLFLLILIIIPVRIFEHELLAHSLMVSILLLLGSLAFVAYALVVSFRRNMMYYLKQVSD